MPRRWRSHRARRSRGASSFSRWPSSRWPVGLTQPRELEDADVVISQPFWPAYLTPERIAKARNLKLAVIAGIGSDHVDLSAAIKAGITVAEVTYCNSISVAEHVVMMILALVRNYMPSYKVVVEGGWNIADCVSRSYDVEGMQIGVFGAGRIGSAVLWRLKPFDVGLHYTDKHRLPTELEKELGVTFHPDVESLVRVCDVVSINTPLHPETENLFDDELIGTMKRGSYIVNTARGKICDREAVARALESGRLAGYAGDVWFPQPAPKDHPWRTMPNHGMTPHTSGTSLSAQTRYAAGVREVRPRYRGEVNLRERHGFTYGASSAFVDRRGPGPFVVWTAVATGVAARAAEEILRELRRLRDESVDGIELAWFTWVWIARSTPCSIALRAILSSPASTSSCRKCWGRPMRPFVASLMSLMFSISMIAPTNSSRWAMGRLATSPPETTTSRTLGVARR